MARTRISGTIRVMALVALALPGPARAASSGFQPLISVSGQYETNPNYRSDGRERSATGTNVQAEFRTFTETQRSRVTFEPSLRYNDYFGSENENLDGEDFTLPASARYSTARTTTGISGLYSQNSTRNGEFEQAIPDDPDNPGAPGSGRVNRIDDDQIYKQIGPYARFAISPRNSIGFSAGYSETSYDQAEITRQPGYENLTTQLSYQHLLDPKNFVFAGINGTYFESKQPCGVITSFADTCGFVFVPDQLGTEITNNTDTFGFNVGYNYSKSETESLNVAAGTARSDFAIRNLRSIDGLPCFDSTTQAFAPCRFEGSETNFVGDMSYSVRSESTTSTISIGRSLQPNSDGATVTQDNAQAYWIREMSPQLQLQLGATWLKSEFVGGSRNGELRERFKREYWRLSIGGTWRLNQRWSVRASYDYLNNEYSDSTPTVENNIFILGLQYTGLQYRRLPW